MKRFVFMIGLLALAVAPLRSDGLPEHSPAVGPEMAIDLAIAESESIRTVIRAQMQAFRSDDAETAFSYAAPGIKAIFRTPQTFIQIVKRRYNPVYSARHVSFRDVVELAGRVIQPVMVIGENMIPVTALYIMERQPDGTWCVGGYVFANEPAESI